MRVFALLLIALLCRAQQSCPWLNQATATGVLGGPVQAIYSQDACRFTAQRGELEIKVSKTKPDVTECGSKPTPLKGIGNEAVVCTLTSTGADQVMGRVRDSFFLIRLRSSEKDRLKLINVAEQVAGSLF